METPPLVLRALALAEAEGFEKSCKPEDGALLHVLAARRGIVAGGRDRNRSRRGRGLDRLGPPAAGAVLHRRARSRSGGRSAELFADDPNVAVLAGPWRASLPAEAPFDLLFVDAHDAKDDVEAVVGLLAPGGTAVLDDFWSDPALPDRATRRVAAPPAADHDRALGHTRTAGARRSSPVAPTDSRYPCR